MLGLRFLPAKPGRTGRTVAGLGRASWHIFLVQMLYFAMVPPALLPIPLDVALPLAAGWAFYLAETRFSARTSGCLTSGLNAPAD